MYTQRKLRLIRENNFFYPKTKLCAVSGSAERLNQPVASQSGDGRQIANKSLQLSLSVDDALALAR